MDVGRLRDDIEFRAMLLGRELGFRTTWGLFSPREIDEGTRLLLKHIEIEPDSDCLDLGCGYGSIGLAMAAAAPRGRTWLVDKDFVAVEYARRNVRDNGLRNAQAALSNGFSQVKKSDFDVIASNLPAKTGKELLYLLLHDAREHLVPGGALWVVTLSGLRRFIARAMDEVFGNYEKVKQGRVYTVARARKPTA